MSSVDAEQKAGRSKPWLPEKWDCEADVVIVGYGGAGVCAAIVAHDAGAQALILEKAPFGGGNTGCSRGSMRIPSDVSSAVEFYRALTQGTVDEESIRALAEAMVEPPRRLEEWGAELEYLPLANTFPALPGSNSFNQSASLARTARQKEEQKAAGGRVYATYGAQLFAFLEHQAKQREIRIRYETPAKELIQDPVTKEILGVKAASPGGTELYVKASRGVVLACGGFQNNQEMLN